MEDSFLNDLASFQRAAGTAKTNLDNIVLGLRCQE